MRRRTAYSKGLYLSGCSIASFTALLTAVPRASLVLALLASTAHAADWRDAEPFTADPATLLAEAAEHADAPAHQLFESIRYTFLDDAQLRHHHRVFVVHDPASLDRWMTLELPWRPEYENQPIVEARVIAPDGTVRALDPSASLVEGPDRPEGPGQTWRKQLRVVLPGPEVGAVVEVLVGHGGKRGLPPAAGVGDIVYYVPRADTDVLRVDAVSSVPLTGLGGTVTRSRDGDQHRVQVELRDIPRPEPDAFVPWTVAQFPVVGVGTDLPPAAMAKAARAHFAPHLSTEGLEELTGCADALKATREKVGCMLDAMHTRLETHDISPRSTSWTVRPRQDVLLSGYASSLEATLLFQAMLDAKDIPGTIGFIESTQPPHPSSDPGWLTFHNQPVIRIGKDWYDVGSPGAGPGLLPFGGYGRPAFLLDGTRTTTPDTIAGSTRSYTYDVRSGRSVQYTSTMNGWVAHRFRALDWQADKTDPEMRERIVGAMAQTVGDLSVDTYEVENRGHATEQFIWKAGSTQSTALLPAPNHTLLRPPGDRPGAQIEGLEDEDFSIVFEDVDTSDRMIRLGRYHGEVKLSVLVPPDHELVGVPTLEAVTHGPITYSQTMVSDGDTITATTTVDVAEPVVRQDDLVKARVGLADLGFGERVWQVRHKALAPFERSEVRAAVEQMKTSLEANPDDPHVNIAWSSLLASLGHPESSMEVLETLGKARPDDPLPAFAMVNPLFEFPLGETEGSFNDDAIRRFLELITSTTAKDPTNPVYTGMRGYTAVTLAERNPHDEEILEEMLPHIRLAADAESARDEILKGYITTLYTLDRVDEMRERMTDYRFLSTNLPIFTIAAIAKHEGTDAAVTLLSELLPSERLQAGPAAGAAVVLMLEGEYEPARRLLEIAEKADPELPAKEVGSVLAQLSTLKPLKPRDPFNALLSESGIRAADLDMEDSPVPIPREQAMRVTVDILRATNDSRIIGDKRAGFVIIAEPREDVPTLPMSTGESQWFTALQTREGWSFIGDADSIPAIGEHVYDRLGAGDTHAWRLLEHLAAESGADDEGFWLFHAMMGAVEHDAEGKRLIAAALAMADERQDVLDTLEQGLPRLDGEFKQQITAGLLYAALRAEQHEQALRLVRAFPEDFEPKGWSKLTIESQILADMGRYDEAIPMVRSQLKKDPVASNYDTLGLYLSRSGKLEEAIEILEEGAELDEVHANLYNNHSWALLFVHRYEDAAAIAKLGLRRSGEDRAESLLHTYACAVAELGRVDEAWEALQNAKEANGVLGDHWWFVVGRIAEELGLHDEAELAYRKVETDDSPVSTWKLSSTRLEAMGR